MTTAPIAVLARQQQAAATLNAIQINVGRATQAVTNSFHAILADATALRATMVEDTEAFTADDVDHLDTIVAGLAQTVQDTATSLLNLLPSQD